MPVADFHDDRWAYRNQLVDAVREAGELALGKFRAPLKSWNKDNNSPVSEVDIAVNEFLQERLRDPTGTIGWLSEETEDDPERLRARRLWIIDPIDGTRGFAQKNGEFSIMVGFVRKGRIELGIVAQPATQRLTYATRGGGCWRRDGTDAAAARCQVTNIDSLERATLTQSRSRNPDKPSRWVQALRPAQVIESHSAGIKLALVARGEADMYLNTYDAFHDWDICAGHILVSEAGGKVTGSDGETLVYGLPGAWQRHGLLATNGQIHDAALARIAPVLAGHTAGRRLELADRDRLRADQ